MVFPKALSWDEVARCFDARGGRRVPALSYYHKANGCSLWRCGQPARGPFNTKSEYDDKLLAEIARINPISNPDGSSAGFLKIYDARGKLAAYGNRARGGGFEDVTNTPNSELFFCDIDNIHAVRKCFAAVSTIPDTPSNFNSVDKYGPLVEKSGYFQMISAILKATNKIVANMHNDGVNILVHCSDGWDRTS